MTSEISELSIRVRNIMLAHGQPISVSAIAKTIEIDQKKVGQAMKLLLDSGKAQVGTKGWRAI